MVLARKKIEGRKKVIAAIAFTAIAAITYSIYKIYTYKASGFSNWLLSTKSQQYVTRFNSALEYLLSAHPITATGLTSWTPANEIISAGANSEYYLVGSEHYIVMRLIHLITGTWESTQKLYPYFDEIGVFLISFLSAIIAGTMVFHKTPTVKRISYMIITFAIALTSPWLTQASTELWNDNWFLVFLMGAIILRNEGKLKLAATCFVLAVTQSYIYGFLISSFYLFRSYSRARSSIHIDGYQEGGSLQAKLSLYLKKISSYDKFISLAGFATFAIYLIRIKLLKLIIGDIRLDNSSLLLRMGADGNEHMAGIVGALRFLGGTVRSGCSKGIACESLSISITLISLASIVGMILVFRDRSLPKTKAEALSPLIYLVISSALIFQQSYWIHPYGYGVSFIPIFSIGLAYLIIRIGILAESSKIPITAILTISIATTTTAANVKWLRHIAEHLIERKL